MLKTIEPSFVDELVSTAASKKNIYGAVLCVENRDNSLSLLSRAGNLTTDQLYFIASVTKLYVTAVILKLRSEKCLTLLNKISQYFSDDILHELHLHKGIEHSPFNT